MTWLGWVLVALHVLNTFAVIARIGKERKPITPLDAVLVMVINGALVLGLLLVGTGSIR